MFYATDVTVLAKRSLDHHPVLVALTKRRELVRKYKNQFRIEEGWCVREDYRRAIHESWVERCMGASPWKKITGKLNRCQRVTSVWVKKYVQATEELISAKTTELASIQKDDHDSYRGTEKKPQRRN